MIHNNIHKSTPIGLSQIQQEIVEVLAYFGVFGHPLKLEELQNFMANYYQAELLHTSLQHLLGNGMCYAKEGHYSINQDVKREVTKRNKNEKNAEYFFNKMPFYVKIMSAFPYVRGVAISGSLSKGVMHKDGDIDYFVITAHNRLWLTRMLLILFKKTILLNSHRFFCINYLVSENHLEIPDKNYFTATEICTLLPAYNPDAFKAFKKANNWTKRFYGHFEHAKTIQTAPTACRYLKHALEWLLNNKVGNVLDLIFMYITIWRWDVKFKHFNRSKFSLTMRSNRNVSKHHPRDFQTVVLDKKAALKENAMSKLKHK